MSTLRGGPPRPDGMLAQGVKAQLHSRSAAAAGARAHHRDPYAAAKAANGVAAPGEPHAHKKAAAAPAGASDRAAATKRSKSATRAALGSSKSSLSLTYAGVSLSGGLRSTSPTGQPPLRAAKTTGGGAAPPHGAPRKSSGYRGQGFSATTRSGGAAHAQPSFHGAGARRHSTGAVADGIGLAASRSATVSPGTAGLRKQPVGGGAAGGGKRSASPTAAKRSASGAKAGAPPFPLASAQRSGSSGYYAAKGGGRPGSLENSLLEEAPGKGTGTPVPPLKISRVVERSSTLYSEGNSGHAATARTYSSASRALSLPTSQANTPDSNGLGTSCVVYGNTISTSVSIAGTLVHDSSVRRDRGYRSMSRDRNSSEFCTDLSSLVSLSDTKAAVADDRELVLTLPRTSQGRTVQPVWLTEPVPSLCAPAAADDQPPSTSSSIETPPGAMQSAFRFPAETDAESYSRADIADLHGRLTSDLAGFTHEVAAALDPAAEPRAARPVAEAVQAVGARIAAYCTRPALRRAADGSEEAFAAVAAGLLRLAPFSASSGRAALPSASRRSDGSAAQQAGAGSPRGGLYPGVSAAVSGMDPAAGAALCSEFCERFPSGDRAAGVLESLRAAARHAYLVTDRIPAGDGPVFTHGLRLLWEAGLPLPAACPSTVEAGGPVGQAFRGLEVLFCLEDVVTLAAASPDGKLLKKPRDKQSALSHVAFLGPSLEASFAALDSYLRAVADRDAPAPARGASWVFEHHLRRRCPEGQVFLSKQPGKDRVFLVAAATPETVQLAQSSGLFVHYCGETPAGDAGDAGLGSRASRLVQGGEAASPPRLSASLNSARHPGQPVSPQKQLITSPTGIKSVRSPRNARDDTFPHPSPIAQIDRDSRAPRVSVRSVLARIRAVAVSLLPSSGSPANRRLIVSPRDRGSPTRPMSPGSLHSGAHRRIIAAETAYDLRRQQLLVQRAFASTMQDSYLIRRFAAERREYATAGLSASGANHRQSTPEYVSRVSSACQGLGEDLAELLRAAQLNIGWDARRVAERIAGKLRDDCINEVTRDQFLSQRHQAVTAGPLTAVSVAFVEFVQNAENRDTARGSHLAGLESHVLRAWDASVARHVEPVYSASTSHDSVVDFTIRNAVQDSAALVAATDVDKQHTPRGRFISSPLTKTSDAELGKHSARTVPVSSLHHITPSLVHSYLAPLVAAGPTTAAPPPVGAAVPKAVQTYCDASKNAIKAATDALCAPLSCWDIVDTSRTTTEILHRVLTSLRRSEACLLRPHCHRVREAYYEKVVIVICGETAAALLKQGEENRLKELVSQELAGTRTLVRAAVSRSSEEIAASAKVQGVLSAFASVVHAIALQSGLTRAVQADAALAWLPDSTFTELGEGCPSRPNVFRLISRHVRSAPKAAVSFLLADLEATVWRPETMRFLDHVRTFRSPSPAANPPTSAWDAFLTHLCAFTTSYFDTKSVFAVLAPCRELAHATPDEPFISLLCDDMAEILNRVPLRIPETLLHSLAELPTPGFGRLVLPFALTPSPNTKHDIHPIPLASLQLWSSSLPTSMPHIGSRDERITAPFLDNDGPFENVIHELLCHIVSAFESGGGDDDNCLSPALLAELPSTVLSSLLAAVERPKIDEAAPGTGSMTQRKRSVSLEWPPRLAFSVLVEEEGPAVLRFESHGSTCILLEQHSHNLLAPVSSSQAIAVDESLDGYVSLSIPSPGTYTALACNPGGRCKVMVVDEKGSTLPHADVSTISSLAYKSASVAFCPTASAARKAEIASKGLLGPFSLDYSDWVALPQVIITTQRSKNEGDANGPGHPKRAVVAHSQDVSFAVVRRSSAFSDNALVSGKLRSLNDVEGTIVAVSTPVNDSLFGNCHVAFLPDGEEADAAASQQASDSFVIVLYSPVSASCRLTVSSLYPDDKASLSISTFPQDPPHLSLPCAVNQASWSVQDGVGASPQFLIRFRKRTPDAADFSDPVISASASLQSCAVCWTLFTLDGEELSSCDGWYGLASQSVAASVVEQSDTFILSVVAYPRKDAFTEANPVVDFKVSVTSFNDANIDVLDEGTHVYAGQWSLGSSAGGGLGAPTFWKNPQYVVRIPKATGAGDGGKVPVEVLLDSGDAVAMGCGRSVNLSQSGRGWDHPPPPCHAVVVFARPASADPSGTLRDVGVRARPIVASAQSSDSSVSAHFDALPGQQYTVVPYLTGRGDAKYAMLIKSGPPPSSLPQSAASLSAEPVSEWSHAHHLDGSWDPGANLSGGVHAGLYDNPQYVVSIARGSLACVSLAAFGLGDLALFVCKPADCSQLARSSDGFIDKIGPAAPTSAAAMTAVNQ
eukprot:gene20181-31032_t